MDCFIFLQRPFWGIVSLLLLKINKRLGHMVFRLCTHDLSLQFLLELWLQSPVLLGSPGSPRSGVTSVIFYSLIALSPVIIARHSDLIVCLIASFVVAFMQTFASANLDRFNEIFQSFASRIGMATDITLGPTFADRFIPFAIALLALVVIPTKWIRVDSDG